MQGVGHTLYIATIYFWTPETPLSISLQNKEEPAITSTMALFYLSGVAWSTKNSERLTAVWGTGMCSEKKILFVLFLDSDVNSSL